MAHSVHPTMGSSSRSMPVWANRVNQPRDNLLAEVLAFTQPFLKAQIVSYNAEQLAEAINQHRLRERLSHKEIPESSSEHQIEFTTQVFRQLRLMDVPVEQANSVAWANTLSTEAIEQDLAENPFARRRVSSLFRDYNRFESRTLVQQARREWLEYREHYYQPQTESIPKILENLNKDCEGLYVATAVSGISSFSERITGYYMTILAGHVVKVPGFLKKEEEIEFLWAFTSSGRIIAGRFEVLQMKIRVLAQSFHIDTLEAFQNWINSHDAHKFKYLTLRSVLDTHFESLRQLVAPINFVGLTKHTRFPNAWNPKSLAHNRYFPRARKEVAANSLY